MTAVNAGNRGTGPRAARRTRTPARSAVVAAAVAVIGAVGASGSIACADSGPRGPSGAAAVGAARPSQTTPPPPKPGDVPPRESLEAALLDETDMGEPFVRGPQSPAPLGEGASGCAALDAATAPGGDRNPTEIAFTASDVLVAETLYAAAPGEIQRAHGQLRDAIATCDTIGVRAADGETVAMTVTPMDIGRPDAVAVSMTGTHLDTVVTGFLVYEALGSVELVYAYMQDGAADGQLAESVYLTALDKMEAVLGPAASPATPM